jgi:hypothetical protein
MALKPLNSVGGFSVGEIPANVILANADFISNNLTVQKVSNLGPVGNVIITGGSANQYLQTDGFGNLTWTTADTSRILNGTSNVSIPTPNGNVNTSVNGVANVFVVTATGANVTGTLDATGNLTAANANLGNLVTANYGNFSNDLVVQGNIGNANNVNVTNTLKTNQEQLTSLLMQQVVYANGGSYLVGNANFTYNDTTSTLTVTGNANVTSTLNGNIGNFSGNINSLNANLGNLATANYVNVSQQINGNVGNFSGNITAQNANLGNLATANYVNVANDLNVFGESNLGAIGNVTITGGTNGQVILTDGLGNISFETLNTISNGGSQVTAGVGGAGNVTINVNYTTNVAVFSTVGITVGNIIIEGAGNLSTDNANLGNLVTANFANVANDLNVLGNTNTKAINANGNIYISNSNPAFGLFTDNLYYANGAAWDLQEAAGGNTQIQYNDGANNFGASANFTYNDASQLLTVNGNANVTNTLLTPNVNAGSGNLTLTSNGKSTVYDATGNVTFPAGGTVTAGNFVGNITANVTVTAANTSVLFSDAGLIAGANGFTFDKVSNAFTVPGDINANGNITANGTASINNVAISLGNISGAGNALQIYSSNTVSLNYNSASYVIANSTGVHQTANGFTASLDNAGNVSLPNNLSVTGNIANANNITATNNITIGGNVLVGNSTITQTTIEVGNTIINTTNVTVGNTIMQSDNVSTPNMTIVEVLSGNAANFSGNVVTPNLTINSALVGNTANFSGNIVIMGPTINVSYELSGNTANFIGNITVANAVLGNLANANYVRSSEMFNGNSNVRIAPNGNVTVSVTGSSNVHTFSNVGVNVVGYVTANGNGTFGALYSNTLTAQGGNLTIYAAAGDNYVELRPTGNGHVNVGNFRIEALATPVNASDAATKQYVDDVAQGLNIHDSCYAATANTLAILTGGTITYNNGTAGVGANLVLSGSPTANYLSANVFDGNVTAIVGSRILVKSEANAAHNGVYVVDSSTVLTRASDYNTVPEVEAGDFVFVQDGTQYNDTGWVQTSVVVTIGTDPINFTQFSGAGTYQAGAGLTLTGTVFSVNVDNVTTEIAGSNVVVKANAQFTTPNIGAATGTSLDLTGNVLANNLNANSLVTAANIQVTSNVLANNFNANSNVTSNNATINLELSGNTANFSGNVILSNLQVNLALVGNTANFSGNITSLNANLGNLVTANYANFTNNIVVQGNIANANNITVTNNLNVGNAANITGNLVAGNISTSGSGGNITGANVVSANTFTGNLDATTANATGNITGGNLVTAGVANVAQLNVTGNVINDLLPNANVTHDLGNATLRWQTVYVGNVDATGNITTTGNLEANNFSANLFTANVAVDIGMTQIAYGNVTTTSISSNQTIATALISGVTGIEWMVKGYDSSGSKYSMALVTAVTDGTTADYSTFGTVNLGGTTGTLAVNIVGSNIELQVTPSSSNSTVWVTQYRTI